MKKNIKKITPNNSFTEFLLYTTPNGKVKVEIFLRDENIWLSQDKIALLFGVQRPAISKHLKNIFESGELAEQAVSSILEHTAEDGKTYNTKFYNLDAIISVGYRVNSAQATHFRIWATERLKEHNGLTTWKNAPGGKLRKTDVAIAKNYLNEDELNSLNRIVSMYLDYAELQANNHTLMNMHDWITRLDAFLQFKEKEILTNSGKVTAEIARAFAESEFEKYRVIQDKSFESNFDKEVKKISNNLI